MLADKIRVAVTAAMLLAGTTGTALAAEPASLLIVHGIPGRDLGAEIDPALPVDVLVNGKICLLHGLDFGDIAGPFDLPAGTYGVAISLANPIAPCSNAAVISASVPVKSGEFAAVVAQLSSKGAPTAGVYPIDVASVGAGKQRFVAIHAADAPTVEVEVQSQEVPSESVAFHLDPGKSRTVSVPTSDSFSTDLKAGTAFFGPYDVSGGDQSLFLEVAVGSAGSGSVTVLRKVIASVD